MPYNHTQSGTRGSRAAGWVAGLAFGLTLLMLLVTYPSQGRAAGQDPNCPNQTAAPGQASLKEMRAAITCLIAFERQQADRKALKSNKALSQLASRHTRLMLRQECFRHRCSGEQELEKRLAESGYLKGGGRYGYGENLGCAQTPLAQVSGWMGSRPHRKNILNKRFRHIGVGVGKGSPQDGSFGCEQDEGYATYTVVFAWRKR